MATKIQQILKSNPDTKILFGEWLSRQGLDAKSQYAYMKAAGSLVCQKVYMHFRAQLLH